MAFTSTNFDSNPKIFVGQGDLVMFDEITDYSGKTLANLKQPKSLGQIVQDSTTWDGSDVENTEIKDEQGNLISAKTTAGTIAFSFELASTSRAMVEQFLQGTDITSAAFGSGCGWSGANQITGFGTALPVFTRPLAIINDGDNRAWVYPKCKITSNLSYSDGLWRIKASVVAEKVDQTGLKTGMIIEKHTA